MSLIYDIFTNILQFTDIHTTYQLSYVDNKLKYICYKIKPHLSIIDKYKRIYKPYIQSNVLNEFLNDLSGNDNEYMKLIQTTIGKLLSGKQIILLNGSCNGKLTFIHLMKKTFDLQNVCLTENIKYYPGKILILQEPATINSIPDTISIKNNAILMYNDENMDKILIERLEKNNTVTTITFKTRYVRYRIIDKLNRKDMDWHIKDKFDNTVIYAFFNFLLAGF